MYRFLCNLLNSPLKFAFNQPVIERHTNWTTKYPAWAVLVPTWSNPTPIEVFYGRAALTNKLAAALMVCFDVFIDEHCLCNLVTTKTNLWNQWNFDSHHSCQIPFLQQRACMNCRIMPPGGWSVSVHLELMKCINAVVDAIDTKRLVDNSEVL